MEQTIKFFKEDLEKVKRIAKYYNVHYDFQEKKTSFTGTISGDITLLFKFSNHCGNSKINLQFF